MTSATSAGVDPRRAGPGFGVLLLAAGIVVVAWPAATSRVLVTLVGVGAVIHGASELLRLFAGADHLDLWSGLVGLVSLFGGMIVIVAGSVSCVAAGVMVGLLWVVLGVMDLASGLFRPQGREVRLPIGLASLLLGIIVLAAPSVALPVLVWVAGAWLRGVGLIMVLAGIIAARTPA